MLMSEKISDGICLALQSFLTITQTDEIFRIISLVLTIISAVIVLARNVYEWYLKASADKKLSKDELKELLNIIDDSVNEVKDHTKKGD